MIAEGTRGSLAQAWREWQHVGSPNPQLFALGVKEVWEIKQPLERGDPHARLAAAHRRIRRQLHVSPRPEPGRARPRRRARLPRREPRRARAAPADEAASALPRDSRAARCSSGAPRRFRRAATTRCRSGGSGDGVMIVGDAAGFVDVPSLKGIHYAMQSGMYAARTAFAALKTGDTRRRRSPATTGWSTSSYIVADMHRTRNMRLAFKDGFYARRGQGRVGDAHRRADSPAGRSTCPPMSTAARDHAGDAVRTRRHADLRQAGRGLQVGQRHARHDPEPTSSSATT